MIQTITSTQNAYIKTLKTLKNKKGRVETGRFIAESDKVAFEALEYGCAESILTKRADHPIITAADSAGVNVYIVNDAIMSAVSESKTPQDVLAVVNRHKLPAPTQLSGKLIIALEDVSDPQNVGTIIRTADAAGADMVILSSASADYTSPKAVRAAMGSVFHVPVHVTPDLTEALMILKENGTTLIAGHLKGSNELPSCDSSCILIGNESRGLSPQVSELADALYKINIYGKAESLNAAVAAGILMYKIADR